MPISVLLPPELKDEENMISRKITSGESIDHYETKRLKKNGHVIDVSLTISPIISQTGMVMGASKIMRDITTQKQLEVEKAKIMSDLLQRNRDLEQFAYIISHNLRAPVANIIGINSLMQSTEFDSAQKTQLNLGLNKSVHALDAIIKDLNYILQTKREINERKMTVNFSNLVNDIKASVSNLIKSEQVTFNVDFSEVNEMLTIKSYLFSIFYNLITNSIKYRKADTNPIIEIKSRACPSGIELIFRDNGLGINVEKNKEQLFGLYKRFHFHIEGKGMGLYMVKTQVESLGGKISIQSSLNNGSEFKIEFLNH
jgi:signal transduction histidine kinase